MLADREGIDSREGGEGYGDLDPRRFTTYLGTVQSYRGPDQQSQS